MGDSRTLFVLLALSSVACFSSQAPDFETDGTTTTGTGGGSDTTAVSIDDDSAVTDDGSESTPDGPDSESEAGSEGGQTEVDLLRPLIETQCAWDFECCSAGEIDYRLGPFTVDAADCTERFVEQLISNDNENIQSPRSDLLYILGFFIRLDRTEANPDQIAACQRQLQGRPCNMPARDDEQVYCEPADPAGDPCDLRNLFTGTQGIGEPCNEGLALAGLDLECMPGSSCEALDNAYVCVDKGLAEEFCESDATCDQGLFCDIADGRCAPKSAVGEPCQFDDPDAPDLGTETLPCADGLSCDPFQEVCVAACSPAFACADDSACPIDHSCIPVDMGPNTYNYCRERQGTNGDRCDSQRDCIDALHCDGSACRTDLPQADPCVSTDECEAGLYCAGTCQVVLNAGAPCTSDLSCNPSTTLGCMTSDDGRLCRTALLGVGDVCVPGESGRGNWCASGLCEDLTTDGVSNFRCAPGLAAGLACDEDDATTDVGRCATENYCFEGFCESKVDSGQMCVDGAPQCLNLTCVPIWDGDYCTDATPTGLDDVVTCDGVR